VGPRKNRASVGGNAVSNPPPAGEFETQGAGKDFFRLNFGSFFQEKERRVKFSDDNRQ